MSEQSEGKQATELREQMAVLAHFSDCLRRMRGLDRAMVVALGEMDRRLNLGPARVYAVRPAGALKLLASYGLSPDMMAFADEVERGEGFTGLAAAREKAVMMPVDHLADKARGRRLASYGLKAVCAVPLHLDGALVGVLNVATQTRVGFTPSEQEFINTMAGPMAATVAAVDFKNQLRERARQLRDAADQLDSRVEQEVGLMAEEVGELREANRRLQQNMRLVIRAERGEAIAKFTTVLADRLRNPLMAVGGFARRLINSLPEGGRDRTYAEAIADRVDDLELMLSEVFKLNRDRDLDLNETPPNLLLQKAYEKAVQFSGRPRKDPAWDLAEGLRPIITDSALLVSALAELVQNAVEATEGRGMVYLETAAGEGGEIVFRVADDGPGISEQDLERVFEPLYTTKSLGTGLGLSVSRDVVKLLGGRLEICERPGGGALIRVSLPRRPPTRRFDVPEHDPTEM